MQRHDLIQGSPEWLAHRSNCWSASDAPAMLGCSPYETRAELLRRLSTGIDPEVDAQTQRIFDAGHRFEELARPLAEEIIGEDLGRVVGSLDVGLSKPLGASFDGITFMDDTVFEHKTLSEKLRYTPWDEGNGDHLPKVYRVQMEQQLLVSGAERALFMASKWEGDTLVEERHCWYVSDAALRSELLAGWRQFETDLAAYEPTAPAAPAAVAKPVAHLPVVFDLRVEGKLVACNLEQYKPAALAYIAAINTKLTTDQDFADASADAKFCRESAAKLKLAIEQALGQMGDVNAAISTVREIAAAFDAKGLALEKQVKTETDARREAIVLGGAAALQAHTKALNQRIGQQLLPLVKADFAGAIKGKRNLDSMQNAVDTELARAKIAANELADRIQLNLKAITDSGLVVHDTATMVLKAPDDLAAVLAQRQAVEREREEKARAAIRAEEEAKAQREAALKVAADQAAARAISQAAAPIAAATTAPAPVSAPVAAPVAPVVARPAPVTADTGERINLGQINERIAPLSITAAGLSTLGFEHVATERASKLYRATELDGMLSAIEAHIARVRRQIVQVGVPA